MTLDDVINDIRDRLLKLEKRVDALEEQLEGEKRD